MQSKFTIPVTWRDQKEFGWPDEPFQLVIESSEDGQQVAAEKEAKTEARKKDEQRHQPLL